MGMVLQGCKFCTRLYFSHAAQTIFFPSLVFFPARKGKNGKIFSELFILFILSPHPHKLLVFFTKQGRKMEKKIFSSLNFYIFSPFTIYSLIKYNLYVKTRITKSISSKAPKNQEYWRLERENNETFLIFFLFLIFIFCMMTVEVNCIQDAHNNGKFNFDRCLILNFNPQKL